MKAMTILVMHRDPDLREELVSLLRGGGYPTRAADSAASAAAQLDDEVDAVLVDLKQADVDRDALVQALTRAGVAEPDSLEAAERRHGHEHPDNAAGKGQDQAFQQELHKNVLGSSAERFA